MKQRLSYQQFCSKFNFVPGSRSSETWAVAGSTTMPSKRAAAIVLDCNREIPRLMARNPPSVLVRAPIPGGRIVVHSATICNYKLRDLRRRTKNFVHNFCIQRTLRSVI